MQIVLKHLRVEYKDSFQVNLHSYTLDYYEKPCKPKHLKEKDRKEERTLLFLNYLSPYAVIIKLIKSQP